MDMAFFSICCAKAEGFDLTLEVKCDLSILQRSDNETTQSLFGPFHIEESEILRMAIEQTARVEIGRQTGKKVELVFALLEKEGADQLSTFG